MPRFNLYGGRGLDFTWLFNNFPWFSENSPWKWNNFVSKGVRGNHLSPPPPHTHTHTLTPSRSATGEAWCQCWILPFDQTDPDQILVLYRSTLITISMVSFWLFDCILPKVRGSLVSLYMRVKWRMSDTSAARKTCYRNKLRCIFRLE